MKKYITIEEYLKMQKTQPPKRPMRNLRKKIVIIVCLVNILLSLGIISKWCIDNLKTQKMNKELEKQININQIYEQGELINPPKDKNSNYYYYATFPFYQVDFSSLSSKNKETVAYIHVNNTNIDYPVVQTDDNQFYLKHSFDKSKNDAGWIFMDYRSDINHLKDNTVIYGHARLDGTMFGSLRNVLFYAWQSVRENYVIFLSSFKEDMIFQIFSIYTIPSENYYIQPDFNDSNEKRKWLETLKDRNIAPIDTDVQVNDKVLTLSTCKNHNGDRIVVHAKLIKKQTR